MKRGRYDADVIAAQQAIKADGELVQWQKTATAAGDQPWRPTVGETTTYDAYIAFVTGAGSLFARLLAGSNLGSGGVRGLMAAQKFIPETKDSVIRLIDPLTGQPATYAIDTIDVVAPNGQVILWKIGFKK